MFNVALGLADEQTFVSDAVRAILLEAATERTQRYLLVDLSVHNTSDYGCSARVLWNVETITVSPGRPPPPAQQVTLVRDGVRIQVPADPLVEPIFCIFHRFGDVILSVSGGTVFNDVNRLTVSQPRILVTIQFFHRSAAGRTGARKIGVTVNIKPMAPAGFAWSSHVVTLQMHAFKSMQSDDEDIEVEESDDDQDAVLQNGIPVATEDEIVEEGGEGGV